MLPPEAERKGSTPPPDADAAARDNDAKSSSADSVAAAISGAPFVEGLCGILTYPMLGLGIYFINTKFKDGLRGHFTREVEEKHGIVYYQDYTTPDILASLILRKMGELHCARTLVPQWQQSNVQGSTIVKSVAEHQLINIEEFPSNIYKPITVFDVPAENIIEVLSAREGDSLLITKPDLYKQILSGEATGNIRFQSARSKAFVPIDRSTQNSASRGRRPTDKTIIYITQKELKMDIEAYVTNYVGFGVKGVYLTLTRTAAVAQEAAAGVAASAEPSRFVYFDPTGQVVTNGTAMALALASTNSDYLAGFVSSLSQGQKSRTR